MTLFNTLDRMMPARALAPQQLTPPKHNKPDAVLGKAVCALVYNATPRFKWRGMFCRLKAAV